MLRITKETEYAFMLLGEVLAADGAAKNTAYLAGRTRIAVPMSGKVLKRLTQRGILESTRGAYGGYQLARDAAAITALDVVEAMEGAPELVECAGGDNNCALVEHCRLSPFWLSLNDDIRALLAGKTLADMQRDEHYTEKERSKAS
ncbi:Rrf2 family transcriptional regulator [uncultured Cardiobacterium sp.]|uniref:RrF2 family transcriptional regulator n=1 Tax=uncultured Cardiobacterium sp. TaxID=417619 RepID=UPI002607001C|nr:Rrf2 family transcriptional regulator [uncultured Cardiobacterium sp.]